MAAHITTSEIGSTQHQIFNNVKLAAVVYQRVVDILLDLSMKLNWIEF